MKTLTLIMIAIFLSLSVQAKHELPSCLDLLGSFLFEKNVSCKNTVIGTEVTVVYPGKTWDGIPRKEFPIGKVRFVTQGILNRMNTLLGQPNSMEETGKLAGVIFRWKKITLESWSDFKINTMYMIIRRIGSSM